MGKYDKFTNGDLRGQRTTLSNAIYQENQKVTALEGDIKRLREAESKIRREIEKMQGVNSKLNSLEINEDKWRGSKLNEFKEHKNDYYTETKSYENQTENIIERIQQEIITRETQLSNIENQIGNFESMMSNITNELNSRGG